VAEAFFVRRFNSQDVRCHERDEMLTIALTVRAAGTVSRRGTPH